MRRLAAVPAAATTTVNLNGYWQYAPVLIIALFAVVVARLQEFFPATGILKPVLLTSVGGTALLITKTGSSAKRQALQDPSMKLLIAYFIWMLITVPTALWQGLAASTARAFLSVLLMFGAVLLCAPDRRILDRLQTGFVVLVLIYAAYAQMFGRVRNGRLEIGGMYDSNDMASLMALGFPMAAGILARSAPGRMRVAAILAVIALGLGVIASGSRGGVLALVAGAVVFALGFRGARAPAVLIALVFAGSLGWFTAPEGFRERMMTLTDIESDYNYTSQSGRKAVWARGRGYIKDNPVFGVGAGNFPIAEGPGLAALGLTGKWSAAHNAYIQVYAELGLTGGTIFVVMLLVGANRARRLWRVPPGAARTGALDRPEFLGSLAAFAAGGYFLSHAYFPPAYALLALIALADRVRAAEQSAPALALDMTPRLIRQPGQRGGLAARVWVPDAAVQRQAALPALRGGARPTRGLR